MRKRLVAMTLVGLAWILPNPAGAWHRGGHMTVARIAWLQMNDQPAMQEQITAILDSHPHRDLYLLAEKPAGATKDEWMFLRAATWPDWVRDPVAPKGQPKLTPQEMAHVIAYLFAVTYSDEPGAPEAGVRVLQEKGCARCHEAGVGPVFDRFRGRATPVTVAQALWNHGPRMLERMRDLGIRWPTLTGEEMNDLLAALNTKGP